jgi:hypothetical protein
MLMACSPWRGVERLEAESIVPGAAANKRHTAWKAEHERSAGYCRYERLMNGMPSGNGTSVFRRSKMSGW